MSVHFDIKYRPFLLNAKHDVAVGLGHLSEQFQVGFNTGHGTCHSLH